MKFSLRLIKSGFEASNSITVGSNTQPWGSAKHQGIGNFIINSGTTVNMVAGQSVKLKSGFKLNSGATFKMKVDPTNPTQKSSSIEKLYAPVIIGDKNATISSMYSIRKQFGNEDVEWQLFGNDFEYSCKTDNFTLPADLRSGQYTLVCRVSSNGQSVSSSKIIIIKKTAPISTTQDKSVGKCGGITVFPNPANNVITIDIGKSDFENAEMIIKDITGKTVISKANINTNKIVVNVSTLAKGVYFIHCIDNGVRISSKKFIKL